MNEHAAPILKRLPEGPRTMAEIGVAAGLLSHELLQTRQDLSLWMVDSWQYAVPGSPYRRWCETNGDVNGVRTVEQVVDDFTRAQGVAAMHRDRAFIVREDSFAAAVAMTRQFDLVFIDADHSDEGCAADLAAWWPKVKPGGWLGGHDIHRFRDDGVGRAVEAFANRNGVAIELDDDWTWFIRKAGAPCQ